MLHTHNHPPAIEAVIMPNENDLTGGRKQLRHFKDAIGTFRAVSSTMPVGEVEMFLTVALNEGLSLTELAEKADMKKSTASRYLLNLSDRTRSGGPGFGLVNRETDPDELRRNMYSLSPKGRKIAAQIISRAE